MDNTTATQTPMSLPRIGSGEHRAPLAGRSPQEQEGKRPPHLRLRKVQVLGYN
jgi:hypothetical protein